MNKSNIFITFLLIYSFNTINAQSECNVEIKERKGYVFYEFTPGKYDTCLTSVKFISIDTNTIIDTCLFFDWIGENFKIVEYDTTLEMSLGKAEELYIPQARRDSTNDLSKTTLLYTYVKQAKIYYASNQFYKSNFSNETIFVIYYFEGILNYYTKCNFFSEYLHHSKPEDWNCGLPNYAVNTEFLVLAKIGKVLPLTEAEAMKLGVIKYDLKKISQIIEY